MSTDVKSFVMQDRRQRRGEEPLYEFFKDSLDSPVEICVNSVTRLDSFRLRYLLSAHKYWKEAQVPFKVINQSETFKDGLVLLGLSRDFFDEKADA